jgi:hypothetical protein
MYHGFVALRSDALSAPAVSTPLFPTHPPNTSSTAGSSQTSDMYRQMSITRCFKTDKSESVKATPHPNDPGDHSQAYCYFSKIKSHTTPATPTLCTTCTIQGNPSHRSPAPHPLAGYKALDLPVPNITVPALPE